MRALKSCFLIALVVICLITVVRICLADSVVIGPNDDTWVSEESPNSNFGNSSIMSAGPLGNNNDGASFVKFPISQGSIQGVPSGSTITNVLLGLYITPGSDRPSLYLYYVVTPVSWTEETLTWAQGWSSNSLNATGAIISSPSAYDRYQFQSTNLTSRVQNWYSGSATNSGFVAASTFNQGSTVNFADLCTKEWNNAVDRPTLTIFYNPPPTPPNAPSNLVATFVAPTEIDLTWNDNSNNEDRFRIDWRQVGAPSWDTLTYVNANVTSYLQPGVPPGTYEYAIRAESGSLVSQWVYSNHVTVPSNPPNPPSNFGASLVPPNSVQLTWTDNSTNEDRFRIDWRQVGAPSWDTLTYVNANITSYLQTGVPPGTYEYAIRAESGSLASPWVYSNQVTVPSNPLPPPTNFVATFVVPSSVHLTWSYNSPNPSDFALERSFNGGSWTFFGTVPGSYRDWTDANLPLGSYLYRIRAESGTVNSDWVVSNPVTVGTPQLDVALTPINPPITIPAQGGSFNFNISVVNHGPNQAPYCLWARIKDPNGGYTAPTVGPVQINTPVNVTITRQRFQTIPGIWMPGVYTYLLYANWTYTYPAMDSSWFTFTKLPTSGNGPSFWDATCSGELFPGETPVVAAQPASYGVSASPNPFNPSTTINYQLQAASLVSLRVFDTTGRLVTSLVEGWQEAGTHKVNFDGFNLASGVYLYTLNAGEHSATGKMLLLK